MIIKYNAVDITKFVFAILLVCAHTASERVILPQILDLVCSLYIIAVPFFFITSSFFFFKKINSQSESDRKLSYKKYSKRILAMYLAWSIVYFCFIVFDWINQGVSIYDIFKYFHQAIVFSTYPTIWFLPALWIGVSLVYVFRYQWRWRSRIILFVALILYSIGAIEYSFHGLSRITESIHVIYTSLFFTWRNGLFNAFIYAYIGYRMAVAGTPSLKKSLIATIVFGFLFVIEAFLTKRIVPTADANYIFMLIPFSYYLFSLVSQIKLPDSDIYVPLRKMSMLIFLSQRLFLTAIPSVVPVTMISGPWDLTDNGVLALILVVAEILIFSYFMLIVSRKFKLLNYLM